MHIYAKLGHENLLRMVRWERWHCPPDTGFEPWRSEAEHATSRSRRLPTILTFTRGWGRNIFCLRPGTEPRALAWKAAVLTTTLGPPPKPLSVYSTSKYKGETSSNKINKKKINLIYDEVRKLIFLEKYSAIDAILAYFLPKLKTN